jgi:hypothetical protein
MKSSNKTGKSNAMYKHGYSSHPLYNIWRGIKKRCNNINDMHYKNYGNRGITCCDLWYNEAVSFVEWSLENGWKLGLSIDRINNNGPYSPENCRYVSPKIQNINQRSTTKESNLPTGVSMYKTSSPKKYGARIRINKKLVHLGMFATPEEASEAYQKAKKERDQKYLEEELRTD